MDLSGKRVIVVGLGKSGIAAAALAIDKGARVIGTDSAPLENLSPAVHKLGVELVTGGHEGLDFQKADLIIVSPGVPSFGALEDAALAGVEVIGELEFASRFLSAPVIAIGGTNGKSTTTTLVGDFLAAGGKKAFVGGNLGTPSAEATRANFDVVVYEVSSFQLERAPSFKPRVSVLLNITEDHLDRYPSFVAYAEAKGNAFVNQTSDDFAIVPDGDNDCFAQARRGAGQIMSFGATGDYVIAGRSIIERASGEEFSLEGSELYGRHNLENAAAAIAAVRAIGVAIEPIRGALRLFKPLPHRMAKVASVRGVNFYDDSKGTNVGASVTALRGMAEERSVLIAGGRDKLGSYEPLVLALIEKGRAAVLIGEAAPRIFSAIAGRIDVVVAANMQEAVEKAFRLARPGDGVLLSPACSSFDMFKSYADRGDQFAVAVQNLKAKEEAGS